MPFFSSNGQQIYFEDSGSGALAKEFLIVKGAAHAANYTHAEPINLAMENFLSYIIKNESQGHYQASSSRAS